MADQSARLAFILSLTDKVTGPAGKIKNTIVDLAEAGQAAIVQMGAGWLGMQESFAGITASMEPALEMNRALGDVRALGVAEDALSSLNAKALDFSVQYGASAVEFVASSRLIEGAIKGLVGNQLAAVTNASSLLAKATKSDTETTGAYLGSMYNLFKTQADKMGKVQWVEQLTGQTALAVKLFRTDGAQLKDAFKEVGAIATTAGISVAEQMAVIGTLSSTMEGGDAGGKYKAFFEGLGAAAEMTGLKFTDAAGNTLPMVQILEKLQGKYGDLTTAAAGTKLTEAFGGDGAQILTALAKDTDRLKTGIAELGKVRGLENAEQMAKAMVDPWQQFGEAVQALRIAFGQALIPMLTPLMDKLVGIGKTLLRWIQLFPNITRVVGIATLAVLGIITAMSALTLVVGMSKLVWLGMVTVMNLLRLTGLRTIAVFLFQATVFAAQAVAMTAFYTAVGLVRGGMLLFQGAIWLVNAAMLANPIGLMVAGIVALGVVIAAGIIYWDEWTGALMNTVAFQWILAQLDGLSAWFGTIGGWAGPVNAAWDSIVGVFKSSVNDVIGILNKIPGVEIDAVFGDMPKTPDLPVMPGLDVPLANIPLASAAPAVLANPAVAAAQPAGVPALVASAPAAMPALVTAAPVNEQAEQARKKMAEAMPRISPAGPTAVPPGGLLRSIQNTTTTQNQGRTFNIEKLTIENKQEMTPQQIENLVGMAVGG